MNLKKIMTALGMSIAILLTSHINAAAPSNFSKAKRDARKIFSNDRETLYCHCKYNKYGKVDLKSCGMQSLKSNKRANRIEWEHIMPASHFGQHFKCWRDKICKKKNGKSYRGRKCCEKKDKRFRQAEAELYNLWPAVGAVNQYRSDVRYGAFHPDSFSKSNWYHGCPIVKKKVTKKSYRIEPDDSSKGIVARANLFMSQKYNIRLSKSQRQLFDSWNKQFPPSERELSWAKAVAKIEGYENPYIKGASKAKPIPGKAEILPPAYLSVPKFKSCLSSKSMGTWESICLPKTKRANCPKSSWQKLIKMDIPAC